MGIVELATVTQKLLGRLAASGWSNREGSFRRVGRGRRLACHLAILALRCLRVGRGRRLACHLAVLALRCRRFSLVLVRALLAFAADGKYAQCGNRNKCQKAFHLSTLSKK